MLQTAFSPLASGSSPALYPCDMAPELDPPRGVCAQGWGSPDGPRFTHFVAAVGPEVGRDPTLSRCLNSTSQVQGPCVLGEVVSEQGAAGVRSRAQENSAPAL